jgi:hypothetical protein
MTTTLDVFDTPVKEFLQSRIKTMGHSPSELGPVVDTAIRAAKDQLADSWKNQKDRLIRERIERGASLYIDAVLSQSKIWNECRERIKAYGSVLLVGAGLSYGSDMPLSNILDDLLAFVRARDWAELRADPDKCLAFKNQFRRICSSKVPTKSHKMVILNFPSYIWEVISLNWDDLLEKASALAGKAVNKQNEDQPVAINRCLWKFHGDVARIEPDNIIGHGGWVFPDEQGYVFDSFRGYIERTGLKGQLFTFLVVGYSEKEKVIYDEIVTLLESNPPRPTYRVGLELKYLNRSHHIVGTAEFILTKIFPLTP